MRLKPYKSSNHHTIELFGRLFFKVSSASRRGLIHFVDLEESLDWHWKSVCNCEAWRYGGRPCRHIAACFEAIAHWANVREDVREEWIERLTFLLGMGYSFTEALQTESLKPLANEKPHTDLDSSPETPSRMCGKGSESLGKEPKRIYHLDSRKRAARPFKRARSDTRKHHQTTE